jgi:NADH-quinone oxidoreductase subunit G
VWFLRTADAICQGCATGCNAHLDYDPRYNRAYRYRPRDNEKVNKFWMCDEGMLTYKLAHDHRVVDPRVRGTQVSTAAALDEVKAMFAGVPPQSVGFVLSAQHSLEDNWALRELGTVLMGGSRLYVSGNPDGYEDKILIHRDKNPNTKGVSELAPSARPFTELVSDVAAGAVTHVIALGGAAPADGGLDRAKVVAIAAHEGPIVRTAAVVLPATSWAEHSGTYVNAQGIRQLSEKGLEPIGASKPAWKQVADLATALGFQAKWSKLKQVRSELTGGLDPGTSSSTATALPAE